MLTQVQGNVGNRLVAFWTSTATGTVRYTVPAGRTFRGHMWPNGSSSSIQVSINGTLLSSTLNSTGSSTFPIPVTLPAGTVVADGNGGGFSFLGIEE